MYLWFRNLQDANETLLYVVTRPRVQRSRLCGKSAFKYSKGIPLITIIKNLVTVPPSDQLRQCPQSLCIFIYYFCLFTYRGHVSTGSCVFRCVFLVPATHLFPNL